MPPWKHTHAKWEEVCGSKDPVPGVTVLKLKNQFCHLLAV